MIRNLLLYLIIILFFSCKKENINNKLVSPKDKIRIEDSTFVIIDSFKKGDIRRYGIFPNKPINNKYFKNVLQLASLQLPITFPKGYYYTNIRLVGKSDVTLIFNDAVITGNLEIINKDNIISKNINIKGKLTILDKLFIRKSKHIYFDTIILKSDTILSKRKKLNRGVSIYFGSKNIDFKSLTIIQTGGNSDDYYRNSAASLQIHGWNNNPENITIKNLEIINAARTGIYISGKNHKIEKVKITNFGIGNNQNMFGLEDANPNEEKEFSGFWMNRCNFCEIDSLIIDSNINNGNYSLILDEGIYSHPSFINNISIRNNAKKLPIKDDKLTNILIKNEF